MDKQLWLTSRQFPDFPSLDHLIRAWRMKGDKIVFTNGCFDILHHGHIQVLIQAAGLGNRLIVGLNTDASVKRLKGESRPVNNQDNRMLILSSLIMVDAVCFFDEDTPENLIRAIRPDVLVKGGDYTKEQVAGAAFIEAYGGTVELIPLVQGFSTSSIIAGLKK